MTKPVIVIGGGGYARVLIEALLCCGNEILGFTEVDTARPADHRLGIPMLGDDDAVLSYAPDAVRLVNGVGSTGDVAARRAVFEKLSAQGYHFANVTHPSAVTARNLVLGEGAQVMAGAILQPGCRVGDNAIINSGARIDHDCVIGDHAHIAPGAVLCGQVTVGAGAHVGAGSTIVQRLEIGVGSLVAAGAVIVRTVAAGTRVAGVPARVMET